MAIKTLFDVEREGDILIVIPAGDLRESYYQDIEAAGGSLLERLEKSDIKGLVLDFSRTDYYGSSALGFFLRLWKRISSHGGRMALCNLSDHEREVLTVTRLETLWPIYRTRAEAVKAVSAPPGGPVAGP